MTASRHKRDKRSDDRRTIIIAPSQLPLPVFERHGLLIEVAFAAYDESRPAAACSTSDDVIPSRKLRIIGLAVDRHDSTTVRAILTVADDDDSLERHQSFREIFSAFLKAAIFLSMRASKAEMASWRAFSMAA